MMKTMCIVLGVYFGTYLPVGVYKFSQMLTKSEESQKTELIDRTTECIFLTNSFLNAFVYGLKLPEMRKGFQRIFIFIKKNNSVGSHPEV